MTLIYVLNARAYACVRYHTHPPHTHTSFSQMHLRERDRELEAVTRHRDRLQGDYDRQVQVNELLNQRFQATVKRMNQEAAALKHTMTRHKEAFKAKLDAMKRAMQSGRGDPDAASMRSGWMSNLGSLLEDGRSLSMIRSRGEGRGGVQRGRCSGAVMAFFRPGVRYQSSLCRHPLTGIFRCLLQAAVPRTAPGGDPRTEAKTRTR